MKIKEIAELVNDFSTFTAQVQSYTTIAQKLLHGKHDALEVPEVEKILIAKFGRETYERMKVAYFKYVATHGGEVHPQYAKLLKEAQDDRT